MSAREKMWTEKYRPESLDDVVGHDVAVDRLCGFIEDGSAMPHLLFAGPPGVGKTAALTAFARDLYGDAWRQNFNEFNASDDRGIDVIRDEIKEWCRTSPAGGHPFQIVFLDEADSLTKDAQAAMRRTMEEFSDNTRWVLTCNYKNQIIGPIQSRCGTFHFGRLDDEDVRAAVEAVIEAEGVDVEDDVAIEKIVRSARGQIRDAVMTLQVSVTDGELREDSVDLFTGVVDDALVEEILALALDGAIDDAQRRLDVEILKEGADPHSLLDSVFRVLRKLDLPPDYRAKTFELLAETEERLQMGLNPHVQFHALLGHLYMAQGLSSMAHQAGENDA